MDWAHDNACLSAGFTNATRLFKYAPQPTVVLKMVKSNMVGSGQQQLKVSAKTYGCSIESRFGALKLMLNGRIG